MEIIFRQGGSGLDGISHSLGQQVFQKIREEILDGTYAKGKELKETAIGEELGVSRTPVREALRQLELEGLITIIPNKGAFVVGFSGQDIRDIYEMRLALEGLCVKRAALSADRVQIERMEEILYLADFHYSKGHMEQMAGLDDKFHGLLYEAGGSKVLEHALKDYHQYLCRARKTSLSNRERAQQSNREHWRILEAVREQNAEKAEEAVRMHIKCAIQNMEISGGREHGQD
ncbi:MAG: GntR family transcriptional regulator [Lachnospiraceae bacterium]|nr:GntR family transcriptional regulator [Lachnospiraceae bacterium]